MPVSNVVNLSIVLGDAPSTRPGFGVSLILADLAAVSGANLALFGATGRTREVTQDTWEQALDDALIPTTNDLYLALQAHFGQVRTPEKAILGRRSAKVAQVEEVEIINGDPVADGVYRVIINGEKHDYTATGGADTEEIVRDALVAAINGGGQAALVTAAPVGTDILTVTSDIAGRPFTISVTGPGAPDITVTNTTPNTGLDSDIALAEAERSDWYLVQEVGHLEVDIAAGASKVNTNTRPIIGLFLSNDSNAQDGASTADIASQLAGFNYGRAFLGFHTDIDSRAEAALSGKMLPADAGTETWGHQTVIGQAGIVPTSPATLEAKRYWWLENYTAAQKTATRNVRALNGDWLDLVRGVDEFEANLQLDLLDLLIAVAKIPNTPEGDAMIETVIRKAVDLRVASGFLVADTLTVSIPARSAQPAADVANREKNGITFSVTATNGIEKLQINGTVAQV